jgi:ABC-2 type transport system ATP-binding protein
VTKLTGRIESAEIPAQVPKSVILQTLELTRRFEKSTAVDALNISVASGEVFGLLGPNGAGKSTVIKMLTTLLVQRLSWAKLLRLGFVVFSKWCLFTF